MCVLMTVLICCVLYIYSPLTQVRCNCHAVQEADKLACSDQRFTYEVQGMDCDDAVAYVKDELDAYPEQKACIKPESIHVIDCDAAVTSEYMYKLAYHVQCACSGQRLL
jgi:hypothetical protein